MASPERFASSADVGHCIAGRHVAVRGGPTQSVCDPATGRVTRQVQMGCS